MGTRMVWESPPSGLEGLAPTVAPRSLDSACEATGVAAVAGFEGVTLLIVDREKSGDAREGSNAQAGIRWSLRGR